MLIADYLREQADALYNIAKGTAHAAERLELVLEAMELEARAVDAERGKNCSAVCVSGPGLRRPKEHLKAAAG